MSTYPSWNSYFQRSWEDTLAELRIRYNATDMLRVVERRILPKICLKRRKVKKQRGAHDENGLISTYRAPDWPDVDYQHQGENERR